MSEILNFLLLSQHRCNKAHGSWHQAISSNGTNHHESLNRSEPKKKLECVLLKKLNSQEMTEHVHILYGSARQSLRMQEFTLVEPDSIEGGLGVGGGLGPPGSYLRSTTGLQNESGSLKSYV